MRLVRGRPESGLVTSMGRRSATLLTQAPPARRLRPQSPGPRATYTAWIVQRHGGPCTRSSTGLGTRASRALVARSWPTSPGDHDPRREAAVDRRDRRPSRPAASLCLRATGGPTVGPSCRLLLVEAAGPAGRGIGGAPDRGVPAFSRSAPATRRITLWDQRRPLHEAPPALTSEPASSSSSRPRTHSFGHDPRRADLGGRAALGRDPPAIASTAARVVAPR